MAGDCPGLGRAEIEANIITVLVPRGILGAERDVAIRLIFNTLLALGHLARCAEHPGRYLLTPAGLQAAADAEARAQEGSD